MHDWRGWTSLPAFSDDKYYKFSAKYPGLFEDKKLVSKYSFFSVGRLLVTPVFVIFINAGSL